MLSCPNPNCGSDQIKTIGEYCGPYSWCSRCGTTVGVGPAIKPPTSKPAPLAPIDLATLKADIASVFDRLVDICESTNRPAAWTTEAKPRTLATLAQLEARERQLTAALEACVEVMDANGDYTRDSEAFTQALLALGRYTN
jgi:hypothetical protein